MVATVETGETTTHDDIELDDYKSGEVAVEPAPLPFRARLIKYRRIIVALVVALLLVIIAAGVTIGVVTNRTDEAAEPAEPSSPPGCMYPAAQTITVQRANAKTGSDCPSTARLPELSMPAGMTAAVFACDLFSPRQLSFATIPGVGDVVFVGSRKYKTNSTVYAVVDADSDGAAESVVTFDTNLDQPNGVAWVEAEGALYVATARRLLRYDAVVGTLKGEHGVTLRTVLSATAFPPLPTLQWHYLVAHGGALYASNSAGCDHCVPAYPDAAAIVKLDPASCYAPTVYASGIRFSVGFTFGADGSLVFTNNAHDSIEADEAWDTVNRATSAGANFGFPYCYVGEGGTWNETFNDQASSITYNPGGEMCTQYEQGVPIGFHVAPLGISFRDADSLLIAERGAWGGPPVGHQVSTIRSDLTGYTPLITGFINTTSGVSWARPVDVQPAAAGSDAFLVSDDKGGAIFRFTQPA